MNRITAISLLLCILLAAGLCQAENLTLSTYYPAPFGAYDRLRLVPRAVLGSPCDPGTFYYESGVGLRLCDEATSAWTVLGGPWTQTGDNIYPTDSINNDLKVGIGTTSPEARLDIIGGVHVNAGDICAVDADCSAKGGGSCLGSVCHYYFTSAGYVGIGTTTPNNRIQVAELINFDNALFTTALGYMAGNANIQVSNTFVGYEAGRFNTTGYNNTFLGTIAGRDNTTGGGNTFVGYSAGQTNSTGLNNTFVGQDSGSNNSTGGNNTFLGNRSGVTNSVGSENTFVGNIAGQQNTTGYNNTFVGSNAGLENTTGYHNTFVGLQSGRDNSTGVWNTFLGNNAGLKNTTGNINTFLGHYAGRDNETGGGNTFVGNQSGQANTTGAGNTFLGGESGALNTTGDNNAFIGSAAGLSNTTGHSNTFLGPFAGWYNTIGILNTFVGSNAGQTNTTGSSNILIGYNVNAPNPTTSNFLNIGDAIYGDLSTGNIGIGTQTPTAKLHVIGKGTFTGGIDPPYISFSDESHESIRKYAKSVEKHEKVMQFWNKKTHRMEVYVIEEDRFYTITGELIEE